MNHAPRGSVGIAPPVGTAVRLLRDGRPGRVVAWSQGGLLCRVRLDGGADAGATLECAGCELVPAVEGDGGPGPGGRAASPGPAEAAKPGAAILRFVAPVAPPAAAPPAAPAAARGRWEFLPTRARR